MADVIAATEEAAELSEERRRHRVCSLRQIAKWLDRPAASIPARWSAIRIAVAQLHHARLGVTAKTLANHKSNVRAALRWFSQEHNLPQHGVDLSAQWARFCDGLERPIRDRLYNFIRYCSARGIGPSAVDDKIFAEYWQYRAVTTARASNNTAPSLHGTRLECLCSNNPWSAALADGATREGHRARLGCLPGGPASGP